MANKVIAPRLTVDAQGCQLHVISRGQTLPVEFTSMVTHPGIAPEIIRIAGGCKGLDAAVQAGMINYFLNAFKVVDENGDTTHEFCGTVFSGGTANMKDGTIKDDMITNVPAHLAHHYPCIAISTTPRTSVMHLDGQTGGLIVDAYGGRIDFRQHAAAIMQEDPANVLGWNGDLELYLTLLEGWQMVGKNVAVIALNGGGVTREEIYGALKRRIKVIAVENSLREVDAFITAFRTGDFTATATEERAALVKKNKPTNSIDDIIDQCKLDMEAIDRSLVSITPVNDSSALRSALLSRGFLKKAAN